MMYTKINCIDASHCCTQVLIQENKLSVNPITSIIIVVDNQSTVLLSEYKGKVNNNNDVI